MKFKIKYVGLQLIDLIENAYSGQDKIVYHLLGDKEVETRQCSKKWDLKTYVFACAKPIENKKQRWGRF